MRGAGLVASFDRPQSRRSWRLDFSSTVTGESGDLEAVWRKQLADGTPATTVLHRADLRPATGRRAWWLYASAPPHGTRFSYNC